MIMEPLYELGMVLVVRAGVKIYIAHVEPHQEHIVFGLKVLHHAVLVVILAPMVERECLIACFLVNTMQYMALMMFLIIMLAMDVFVYIPKMRIGYRKISSELERV